MGRILTVAGALLMALAAPARAAPGDLDPSFGAAGRVVTPCGPKGCATYDVARDVAGRIVVTGAQGNALHLDRYRPNGSLDQTFGVNGSVGTGAASVGVGLAITRAGRIVVTGQSASESIRTRGRPSAWRPTRSPSSRTGGSSSRAASSPSARR